MAGSTEQMHMEVAVENKLIEDMKKTLSKMGITEAGTEIPVSVLEAQPASFGGFGSIGSFGALGAFNLFKRLKARGVKTKVTPKGPAAIVKQSDVIAASLPMIKEKAKKIAEGAKKAIKEVAAVSTPSVANATLRPAAAIRVKEIVEREIMEDIPEAAVTGGSFYGTRYETGPVVEGFGFGDDLERGAAVFGDDISRGASAFSDFLTAGEVADAGVVSGLGDDVATGASAFGDDIDTGAASFGDDIDAGAAAFSDFITAGEVESAGVVSGLGNLSKMLPAQAVQAQMRARRAMMKRFGMRGLGERPAVFTGKMPGATRQVWTDTFIEDPALDWSDMVYPKGGGIVEKSQRPPTVANTAEIAKQATQVAMKVMEEPGDATPAQRMTKAAVAVSKLGVTDPKKVGVGQAQTAGQAAFKPVMKGIQKFAQFKFGKWKKARAGLRRAVGLTGFDGSGW